MAEARLEKKLRDGVKLAKGLAIKFFCSSFTGLPDRIVLMPGARIWFIEMKSPGKIPNRRQVYVHRLLRNFGFTVLIIDTNEKVIEFLKMISEK